MGEFDIVRDALGTDFTGIGLSRGIGTCYTVAWWGRTESPARGPGRGGSGRKLTVSWL